MSTVLLIFHLLEFTWKIDNPLYHAHFEGQGIYLENKFFLSAIDLENGKLLVNVKASKLNFVDIIENHLQKIIEKIEKLDLEQYRFINATNLENNIKCYYKGYKSKKDVIE